MIPICTYEDERSGSFVAFLGEYIAFVEELPGANTQGETLEEARINPREAVELVLDANRTLSEQDLVGQTVIRERLSA